MSKQRMINTRFWVDPWVQEDLNSMDRLLFLYLLTNDQTNLSGIYEISNFKMCFETGIEKETLLRAMFPRLAPKVYREGNWVILINFPKHQNTNNPSIVQGILRELDEVPADVLEKAKEYGYSVPLGYEKGGTRGVEGTPNLTKLNLTKDSVAIAPRFSGEGEYTTPTKKEKDENLDKCVKYWRKKCVEETGLTPATGIPTIRKKLKEAHAHLSWPQIKEKINEWFENDLEDHEKIQITRCFSAVQIDKFKAENV